VDIGGSLKRTGTISAPSAEGLGTIAKSPSRWFRISTLARGGDGASQSDRFSEARALELRHPPVGIGAELGHEGLHGFERALDRDAVRDGLRGKQAQPRQLDVAGAEAPALPPLDGLARFGEERAGSGAISGGPLRVRERGQAVSTREKGLPRSSASSAARRP